MSTRQKIFFIIAIFVFVVNINALPYGLVALWSGEGNALDSIGNHHGNLVNGVSFDQGVEGQAFKFDGNNDYIVIPDINMNGLFESNQDFSVALWINKTPNRSYPIVMSYAKDAGYNGGFQVMFYGAGSSSTDYGTYISNVETEQTLAVARGVQGVAHNEWVFASIVYESGNLFLYENGNLVASDLAGNTNWIKPDTAKSGGLVIGTASHTTSINGSVHEFTGLMDEIQIYNRALSETEINNIINPVPELSTVLLFGLAGILCLINLKIRKK